MLIVGEPGTFRRKAGADDGGFGAQAPELR
jgi:hypothetical protein